MKSKLTLLLITFAFAASGAAEDQPQPAPVLLSFQRIELTDQFWCEGASIRALSPTPAGRCMSMM